MINWGTPARHVAKARLGLIPILPFVIPLTLAPLLVAWWWLPLMGMGHDRENLLFSYLMYIVIVRFMLLDLMLFYVSSKRSSIHFDLLHIVFLYLEITAVTLLFFALLYHLFGVFQMFDYNGMGMAKHLLAMQGHSFRVALYISVELFTTLGLGDWVPRTLNAMLAVSIEALLGFVQGGVFFAVLIYAHQNKPAQSG
ncbi:MAG: ion channel [Betaproteobacteria bacterium]|nr:ion channel [Betaproteobacteria bacterium]